MIIVLSSVPAEDIDYSMVFTSAAVAYQVCTVNNDKVSTSNPITFETYFSVDSRIFRYIPIDDKLASFSEGNPVLTIPKSVFFEPTESSREGLLYFGLIPNGNCYRNDVVIHLALWNKQQQDYVGIFRLSSRSSYECAVIVEKEDSAEFLREYNASQKFLKKYSDLERDYNFAPKSDAFKNIEDAKAVVFPNDEHTLRGEFVFGKKYTRCMKYTLEDVVKG